MKYTLMKDKVVRKLFTSSPIGKKYSAAIIANVLGLDEEEVYNNLEYASENIGTNANYISSEADAVFVKDKMIINIEFNNQKGERTNIKNETYIVQLYLKQLHSFKDYLYLKKIIQINIDNYDYFNKDKFLYKVALMETTLHIQDREQIEIYHINLSYLRKKDYNNIDELKNRLEELVYVLICENKTILNSIYEKDELMKKVSEEARQIAEDMLDWAYYDPEEIARENREIDIIRAQEKATRETTISFVNNMLNIGLDDETILKVADITQKELDDIRKAK